MAKADYRTKASECCRMAMMGSNAVDRSTWLKLARFEPVCIAANAKKYGALSSALGRVKIEWKVRHVLGAPRKLAIVLDRARRAGGAASAASRFWFTAHQESTRRVWRSAAGLQSHWSRLLHAPWEAFARLAFGLRR